MGLLVDGKWVDQWYDTKSTGGRFVRQQSAFRNWVTPDGAPGPSGSGGFAAEPGRYHLYFAHACPWAHRTIVFRKLKGLEDMIGVTSVDALMADEGWTFGREPGSPADPIHGAGRLYEVYQAADSAYTGRVTVPVLWDKKTGTIVSNESAEIIRMLNTAFNAHLPADKAALDFYPEHLRAEIDAINDYVYDRINNGVYKSGFATTQDAYEEAVTRLFEGLDAMEARLGDARYLMGSTLTEADWRLFTTLVRFDAVYVGHFKCNIRRIADYPNLSGYLRELYQMPGIAQTVRFDPIKRHYYASHATINPAGIVPKGPALDLDTPHGRERLS
ncbi:MAG: glutathione S-transferase family protein [Alphaproteobacteria bacterium]